MGKYSNLGVYLQNSANDVMKLTFAEVENILGFNLPKSAREYPAWWANSGGSHTHAIDGWLSMGWNTSVDLNAQVVIFTKKRHVEVKQQNEEYAPKEISISAAEFEEYARIFMSKYYSLQLLAGKYPGVPKIFDMLSDDNEIVGDAKFYTMVRGISLPPAKFATIAEHVWLLEKTGAKHKFLIFGNDKRVPKEWLKRYGGLVDGVDFFFYDVNDDKIERLNKAQS
ncbi:hypothetical protein [Methanolobus sp. ZRKC5]|uniref:DUF7662 domain-containing protein n=1 Tax=unclassified Methanolobus TaxID=2629569 RepID=UPI00313D130D